MVSSLSLSPSSSYLEQLPLEVLGIVTYQLTTLTGSEGILNEADIPVIMRYTRALACTSKTMNEKMNSFIVTNALLKSLSKKYLRLPKYFVTTLDTVGSRRWLWNYIEKSSQQTTYQIIQSIHEIICDIKCELSNKAKKSESHRRRRDSCYSSLFTTQCTQSGYFLRINRDSYSIITPLGEKLFTLGKLSPTRALSLMVIKRLKAQPHRQHNHLYSITEIAGKILPPPHKYLGDTASFLHQKLIYLIYDMLEKNSLGKNPLQIYPKHYPPMTIAPCFLPSTDLIPWAVDIAKRLMSQPVNRWGDKSLKLESLYESLLFYILHVATGATNIRQSSLDGSLFLNESDSLLDLNQLPLLYRTVLQNLQSNWKPSFLKDYPTILKISHNKSEEDFALFIQETPKVPKPRVLLYYLAELLKIPSSIMDPGFKDCTWYTHQTKLEPPDIFYIWIRKDSIEKVVASLGLILVTASSGH